MNEKSAQKLIEIYRKALIFNYEILNNRNSRDEFRSDIVIDLEDAIVALISNPESISTLITLTEVYGDIRSDNCGLFSDGDCEEWMKLIAATCCR